MTKTAQLENGRLIEYLPEMIGEGTMKQVYFSKDKEFVLCFYKNLRKTDINRLRRLQKILTEFNPTLQNNKNANYWNERFCWPTSIIKSPTLGIMTPVYPKNYFFASGRWQGKEKKSRWFISPKLRQYLPKEEQSAWINYYKIGILLARAVNRLHLAGLAHSDLSDNNVLIDPTTGQMIIIDIDSIVVPQTFPPDVEGTPGYIAPEVLATAALATDDPKKQFASIRTDQHALAVLIYEYLLNRHPLRGPKIHSTRSAEEDERLSLGKKALFIEHPDDTSNHPKQGLKFPVTALGSTLTALFYNAFITGLHSPDERPSAYEWESGLIKTWNMLHPCPNPNCTHQWFIVIPEQNRCPFCHTPIKTPIPILTIRSQKRPGQWMQQEQLVIYHGQRLFKWHIFDNIFPRPNTDKTPQAYCVYYQGKWLLINQALTSLTSPNGNRVDVGKAIELRAGTSIRLSQETHGCLAEIQKSGVQTLVWQ
ncbi:MAG: serine/threonine protein kinase [Candidatus Parabeggiatoa sp. nov. 2]|nr:MAG: serine/threonine protein kinase [Beggiatoa sp. 4572_84]RKZ61992.1 MAG: serine/threonine protein kinase [Gammaproteobacteria bacterium]